jgi:hypothetical protein
MDLGVRSQARIAAGRYEIPSDRRPSLGLWALEMCAYGRELLTFRTSSGENLVMEPRSSRSSMQSTAFVFGRSRLRCDADPLGPADGIPPVAAVTLDRQSQTGAMDVARGRPAAAHLPEANAGKARRKFSEASPG